MFECAKLLNESIERLSNTNKVQAFLDKYNLLKFSRFVAELQALV